MDRIAVLLEYIAARFVLLTLEYAPLPIAYALARAYASLLDRALPKLRHVARKNLALAGYADPEPIIEGVFRSIARLLVAFARFPRIGAANISEWVRLEGGEHYQKAKKRGKGVLFATAHIGNWELSAFAHALLAEPMQVVVRPLDNARIDAVVEERRRLSGNALIQKKDAARAILRALGRNEAVGILVDQNSSLQEGVFVEFFGTPACANASFAKIAAHTGAAVIPGFALWSEPERRYVLRFYPPLEITGDAAADTQRLQAVIEQVIREYPEQWLWIHRRWKTRPAGEPPLY